MIDDTRTGQAKRRNPCHVVTARRYSQGRQTPCGLRECDLSAANFYNERAAAERIAAEEEILPQRRMQHERAAERWEQMAQSAQETQRRAAINEADKRAKTWS